ncbi:thioredoxin [Paenibacillus tianmuensis]|uniref:Thioredoxin n=1 Tax=Paenibacillus tianmuensis TaxID=624147 RepID=A0A1G4R7V0_9BACL|nr:thioredoxin [Paenibacillus tianmuensis]SCW52942.1 thioredoxin [Paenibacillus tianmuensis]
MTISHTTDTTFINDLNRDGLTLVNFWAPWCSPCRFFGTILEAFDREHNGEEQILKVNVDEQSNTASQFGVMSIPTTILFKNGAPVDKIVGAVPIEELKKFIANHKN